MAQGTEVAVGKTDLSSELLSFSELPSLGQDPYFRFLSSPIQLLTATTSQPPLPVLKATLFLYHFSEGLHSCIKLAKDSVKKNLAFL